MPFTTSDPELKAFLEAFYGASDLGPAADPKAHADYASYYAPDASLIMGAKHFAGKEGVLDFRRGGWAEVASRHHVVKGVFLNDAANDVIMLHGTVRYGLKTGQQSEMSWAARMQLVRDGSRGFLIKHYQVWLVRQWVSSINQTRERLIRSFVLEATDIRLICDVARSFDLCDDESVVYDQ
jgi:hypothetical protein